MPFPFGYSDGRSVKLCEASRSGLVLVCLVTICLSTALALDEERFGAGCRCECSWNSGGQAEGRPLAADS